MTGVRRGARVGAAAAFVGGAALDVVATAALLHGHVGTAVAVHVPALALTALAWWAWGVVPALWAPLLLALAPVPGLATIGVGMARLVAASLRRGFGDALPAVDRVVLGERSARAAAADAPGPDEQLGIGAPFKLAAIRRARAGAGPEAVRQLQSFLHDDDPDVRSAAAVSLTRLEDRIHTDIERAVSAADTDELAAACERYAASGLVDAVTAQRYLTRARAAYEQ